MCFYPLFWNGLDIDGVDVTVEKKNFINIFYLSSANWKQI